MSDQNNDNAVFSIANDRNKRHAVEGINALSDLLRATDYTGFLCSKTKHLIVLKLDELIQAL